MKRLLSKKQFTVKRFNNDTLIAFQQTGSVVRRKYLVLIKTEKEIFAWRGETHICVIYKAHETERLEKIMFQLSHEVRDASDLVEKLDEIGITISDLPKKYQTVLAIQKLIEKGGKNY